MKRIPQDPRPDAMRIVEAEGLVYAREYREDGTELPYWHEHAAYEFTGDQVDHLEQVTQELHDMSMAATMQMACDPETLRRLQIPQYAWEPIRDALRNAPTLYGRFDLVWDGESRPKMLEYNADTPAGLVECAVSQWTWLESVKPNNDQWNMVHERLIQTWQRLGYPGDVVHLAASKNEPAEDWNTVAYLSDTVREAGLKPKILNVEDIGLTQPDSAHFGDVHPRSAFVDPAGRNIRRAFVMYPWEWMLAEDFGRAAVTSDVTWLEPVYKVLTGSKALLVKLWEMYPDHPNLLPAFWDRESLHAVTGSTDCAVKPVYGWEGAGVTIIRGGEAVDSEAEKHTAGQPVVYQAYRDIVPMAGNLPVLGTWVIGGKAAGLGIRETDAGNLITNREARFVPHYMTSRRSTPEEVTAWLHE